jgi:hypothetical protein
MLLVRMLTPHLMALLVLVAVLRSVRVTVRLLVLGQTSLSATPYLTA